MSPRCIIRIEREDGEGPYFNRWKRIKRNSLSFFLIDYPSTDPCIGRIPLPFEKCCFTSLEQLDNHTNWEEVEDVMREDGYDIVFKIGQITAESDKQALFIEL